MHFAAVHQARENIQENWEPRPTKRQALGDFSKYLLFYWYKTSAVTTITSIHV